MSTKFLPWVGPQYEYGLDGLRVLVLGESHYVRPGDHGGPDLTTRSINENAIGVRPHRFFTKAAKLVMGRHEGGGLPQDERVAFWNRVAFYNFVQDNVGDGPRQRPTEAMWKASGQPFLDQLAARKPHCIVVLGHGLWSWLPASQGERDLPVTMKIYEGEGWRAVASYSKHPSAGGFSYKSCGVRIAALMADARKALPAMASAGERT